MIDGENPRTFRQSAAVGLAIAFTLPVLSGIIGPSAVSWASEEKKQDRQPVEFRAGVFRWVGSRRIFSQRGVRTPLLASRSFGAASSIISLPPAGPSFSNCYLKGERVAKDTVQAVKWFRQAADQGDASAQLNLGYCSATGQGVAPDPVEAVKWLRKAADQGQSDAQYSLGECYASGQGVKKDAVEAADWYRKAAEQGHPEAQAMLKLRSPSRLAGLGLIAVLVGGGAVVWYFRRR